MNDIFKLFKKRSQSGKGTNIHDVIKDLNEKEQDEIMGSDVGKFDRANKSYLSISKSGRLKSKKSQNQSRVLNDDLFNPANNLRVCVVTCPTHYWGIKTDGICSSSSRLHNAFRC